jgi:phospholipid/cholesterol/gamma-HCH transport system permease protein
MKSLERIGEISKELIEWLGDSARYAVRTAKAMFTPPFHLSQITLQLDRVGFGSLFIVSLTGLFTGLVFAMNSLNALLEMRAEGMVAPSMTLSLSRELGPILASLLVAGRTGSAIATELGTMRVSEQIDAMEMMGVDPVQYLVAPRAWALVISLPLLNFIFVFAGLAGSVIAAKPYGISAQLFAQEAMRMADANDILIGGIKTLIFGFMIAVVAARQGMRAEGGARGVGKAATQTVVIASVLVLLLDYLLMVILAPVMLGFDL